MVPLPVEVGEEAEEGAAVPLAPIVVLVMA